MQFADIAARLYGENFCEQIGDWCRQHGVEYIGHVIEDGGMHAHMGIGAGHYFHALWGQDMAGIDVVLQQIRPGLDDCKFHSVGGNLGYHGELYHYALAKLAASLAHMDSKKKGRALCEVFGAYGWAEGLKLMKWLLDHMLVNGINYFVPHAFSMKDFPDPDCPPHFYARGMNPQFPYFKNLMEYCNRVSHLISNGVHIPAVAVVYPAEQEWAGEYLPVEAIGKQLLRNQIDYEILPTDVLLTMTVVEGKLKWGNEQVPVLILSGSRCITKMLADWLCKAAEKGLKIVVVGQKPLAMDNNGILREWTSQIKDNLTICEQEDLADILYSFGVDEIKTKKYEPWLRYYHYKHQNGEFWLFMNQSETEEINTSLCFEDGMMDSHKIDKECSCWYQAWENTVEPCEWDENNDLSLQLVPGEMKVLYMGDCTPYAKILAEKQEIMKLKKATDSQTGKIEIVPDAWKLWIKDTGTEKYVLQEREKTGDFCRKHPYFCGVMRYETTVFLPKIKSCELNLGEVYETAHVLVNEKEAGVRVALPYSFEIGKLLHEGENRIIVEVVNTLANRQRDFFSMTMPIEPSGLIGAVTLDYF
jgi:glycoside hydrolase family 2 sugar binding